MDLSGGKEIVNINNFGLWSPDYYEQQKLVILGYPFLLVVMLILDSVGPELREVNVSMIHTNVHSPNSELKNQISKPPWDSFYMCCFPADIIGICIVYFLYSLCFMLFETPFF